MGLGLGLFLVPILAGYWSITHRNRTRYMAARQSGYHVFFRAGLEGTLLFMVAFFIIKMIGFFSVSYYTLVVEHASKFFVFTQRDKEMTELTLLLVISFGLGFFFPFFRIDFIRRKNLQIGQLKRMVI